MLLIVTDSNGNLDVVDMTLCLARCFICSVQLSRFVVSSSCSFFMPRMIQSNTRQKRMKNKLLYQSEHNRKHGRGFFIIGVVDLESGMSIMPCMLH